jgi:2-oxoglutarate ferredoxin oxidoreductase subunit gamma
MKQSVLISGFGGQGLMRLGKIIAEVGLREGNFVSWFPSYGAEMRGGTAHCFVKISETPIASPLVVHPDIAMLLNQPSFNKFKNRLRKGSLLITNSNLMKETVSPVKGVESVSFNLNAMAIECGSLKVLNSIVLGMLSALKEEEFRQETIADVLKETFAEKNIQDINLRGLNRGRSAMLDLIALNRRKL